MAAEATMALSNRAASYLKQPYARIVIPETDGTYRGEILEFPGCIATGGTPAEALEALEEVAAEWLEAALKNNQPVPAPVENTEFSGRLVLRMPKSLHKKAARLAERDGVSLNQFILTSLAIYIGECVWSQNIITFNSVISSVISGNSGSLAVYPGAPSGVSAGFPGQFVAVPQGATSTQYSIGSQLDITTKASNWQLSRSG